MQRIAVSLEIDVGPPTSIAPGYIGTCRNVLASMLALLTISVDRLTGPPSANDVEFVFPSSGLSLYGSVESLRKCSPYFTTLFDSGFAEGSLSTPEQGATKSNQRKVEREFDDSDDETDDYILSKLPPTAPIDTDSDTPDADQHPPVNSPAKIDSQFRHVTIDATAYTTYHAVLCYLQTRHISFAPLRSSFRLQPDPTALRNSKIAQLQSGPSRPLAASPKSVFRLAHFLELPKLAKLALANIKSQLTEENIAFEVYGDVAAVYDEVATMDMELAREHDDAMGASAAMEEVGRLIVSGDLPSFATMSFKFIRIRRPSKLSGELPHDCVTFVD